jgi:hypothetical protein
LRSSKLEFGIFRSDHDDFVLLNILDFLFDEHILVEILELADPDNLRNLEQFVEDIILLVIELKQLGPKDHVRLLFRHPQTVLDLLLEPDLEFLLEIYY